MSDNVLKNSLILLVVLMALVFVWQPLSKLSSKVAITNDFVLETTAGALDSRHLRGKVLAISLAYGHCADECAGRLERIAKGYDMLTARDRNLVRLIVVSVDPDRDTLADIGAYARGFHPDMIGATGKPEQLTALVEGFTATYKKLPAAPDGEYRVDHSRPIYLVDAEGRFVSALNENSAPEQVMQALRAKLPALQPPG